MLRSDLLLSVRLPLVLRLDDVGTSGENVAQNQIPAIQLPWLSVNQKQHLGLGDMALSAPDLPSVAVGQEQRLAVGNLDLSAPVLPSITVTSEQSANASLSISDLDLPAPVLPSLSVSQKQQLDVGNLDLAAVELPSVVVQQVQPGGFDPVQLFGNGEAISIPDPSKLTLMYQDRDGRTPVTAHGQSVGLLLDGSRLGGSTLADFIANQPNIVSAGDRAFTVKDGVAPSPRVVTVNGSGYAHVTFDQSIATGTRGRIRVRSKGGHADVGGFHYYSGNGSFNFKVNLDAGGGGVQLWFYAGDSGSEVNFLNISAKEIPGIHYSQSVISARPTYETDGTLHWLMFNGLDDFLETHAKIDVAAGWYMSGGFSIPARLASNPTTRLWGTTPGSTQPGVLGLYSRTDVVERLNSSMRLSAFNTVQVDNAFAIGNAFIGQGWHESDTLFVQSNDGAAVSVASAQTGASSQSLNIGNTSGLSMKFFGGVYIDRPLTASEQTNLRAYLAAKSGVTL